ncbi:MAG: 50S ribosomal protein L11 methyltransferase [Hyphomicrobium sp.]|nr:50S ribosomal protein L11 methyltransferase [Hyphomicrobium sp.]
MSQEKVSIVSADRVTARAVAGALQDLIEPPPHALTLFEDAGRGWTVEAYFDETPDAGDLRRVLADMTGLAIPEVVVSEVPALNWVALSQAALPPVIAGRFTVHGSHDRARVARGPFSILVDAGEAFGTAHHATTFGCLQAIDRLTRCRPAVRRVLDLGCGSGVLAIAVARTLPHSAILATDMDPTSVDVARRNIEINGTSGRVAVRAAAGLADSEIRKRAPYDLLIANILAGPLMMLASAIRRAVRPGGTLLLSGILLPQAAAVVATYNAHGFVLMRHDRITGWSTLTFRRR